MAKAATYEYAVRDKTGKVVTGKIEAENRELVASKLTSMGYAPITIKESGTGLRREIKIPGLGEKVKLKDLAIMSRQFATMINSGLPLLRALRILEDETENKKLAEVMGDVRADVEAGSSLSESMRKHPDIFPPLMINMVMAGEVGGFLDEVLLQVAANLEAEVRLRGKVKSAMTYPVVVFVVAILAMVAMLLFIVPVFDGVFAGLGGELPAPTKFLVMLSGLMKVLAIPLLIALIVGAVVWSKIRHKPRTRDIVDPIKLKIPIFGKLFQKVALSRFTRNLGTMTRSGVPILQALRIVASTSGNVVIARAVADVEESVRQGQSLAGPLKEHPVFPPMVVNMLAVGEDTGTLDTMLYKISEFYDQEVEATTEALTSIIEPIMIAVVGGMVGAMLIALYMPIFKVFELVQ